MHAREQYLESLRDDYRRANKKEKSRLLSGPGKRTRLNRKVLIRKLAHPRKATRARSKRVASYGGEVAYGAGEFLWELLDHACGQRLVAAICITD
jgi:hypothetical protein